MTKGETKYFEKLVKQVRNEANKDMKQHIGALIENMDGKLKGVEEGMMGINKKLDEHTKILDSHTEQIANLLMDTTILKSDVRQIKLDIKLDLNDKVDKKHFVDLEGRMRKLEKA